MHVSNLVLDETINDGMTVAMNIFERVLLQSFRLAAFLKSSPILKSQQNIHMILVFVLYNAKTINHLASKWNEAGIIEYSLNLSEVRWICAQSMLILWDKGKMSHRTFEKDAIKTLIKKIEKSQNFDTELWNNSLKYFYSSSRYFNQNSMLTKI